MLNSDLLLAGGGGVFPVLWTYAANYPKTPKNVTPPPYGVSTCFSNKTTMLPSYTNVLAANDTAQLQFSANNYTVVADSISTVVSPASLDAPAVALGGSITSITPCAALAVTDGFIVLFTLSWSITTIIPGASSGPVLVYGMPPNAPSYPTYRTPGGSVSSSETHTVLAFIANTGVGRKITAVSTASTQSTVSGGTVQTFAQGVGWPYGNGDPNPGVDRDIGGNIWETDIPGTPVTTNIAAFSGYQIASPYPMATSGQTVLLYSQGPMVPSGTPNTAAMATLVAVNVVTGSTSASPMPSYLKTSWDNLFQSGNGSFGLSVGLFYDYGRRGWLGLFYWLFDANNSDGIPAATVPAASGSSTSSVTLGTGPQTFLTQTTLAIAIGDTVVLSSGANQMQGVCTSNIGNTLSVNVTSVIGSGTYATWNIAAPAGKMSNPVICRSTDGITWTPSTAYPAPFPGIGSRNGYASYGLLNVNITV
ncbi:MAG: hypothetical protein HQL37_10005 [Alphaproteobacteria bacterium]|nr:hypothetical protein [Alphaproteobacteria bacterium]